MARFDLGLELFRIAEEDQIDRKKLSLWSLVVYFGKRNGVEGLTLSSVHQVYFETVSFQKINGVEGHGLTWVLSWL